MKILKEVLSREVFPAFGCTEPIAVAYAAAVAARELAEPVRKIRILVDPGVYKNGKSVFVPNTGGERGNLIAGVIGALMPRPELRMEILKAADPELVERAKAFIDGQMASIDYDDSRKELYIDAAVTGDRHNARAVISGSHTNLVHLERDGKVLIHVDETMKQETESGYRSLIRNMRFSDLVALAETADREDLDYIRRGIDMNLAMAEEGLKLKKVGYQIAQLMKLNGTPDDVIGRSKSMTAAASDGRMSGLPLPVMSSGGAGNQGVVAILVACIVGKAWSIDEPVILKSIGLSHLVNSYVKCFTGDLSAICGCAIAAGMGAAVALVYQQCGPDMQKIGLAVNTVVSDLGGIFCDGAKEGCAVKVASSTDSAIRAAYMAINGFGISPLEGIAGNSPEQTIRNLGRLGDQGMTEVNRVILGIMREQDHVNG